MKKSKILLAILCLVLCFGIAYASYAETPLSAKQLVLLKLKDADFGVNSELYKVSSGTANYELKAFGGALVPKTEPYNSLAGTLLTLDYKLDSPAKKLEANYKFTFNKEDYSGSVFMSDNKMIFTTEIMSLLKAVNPAEFGGETPLPQYVYWADKELVNMWDMILKYNGQSVPPEVKELLVFALEAVPDQYFTTSLNDQKVIFKLDQSGFEDVVFSLLQKVKNERVRFATLMANAAVVYSPSDSPAEIKESILEDIERSINDGSYPEDRAEIAAALAEALVLEDLTVECPMLSSGESTLTMALRPGADTGMNGRITLNGKSTGSKENMKGDYVLNVAISNNKQGMSFDGKITGAVAQTAGTMTSQALISFNVKNSSGSSPLVNLVLQADSSASVQDKVKINVPVLTPFNSMNIEEMTKQAAVDGVKVVLDGERVSFDVAPFIQNGRTMVPIRNLAEKLGFEVTWIAPNQVKMTRGDESISMYLNQLYYQANGVQKKLDVPPYAKDGRTIVPIRFIAEEFGCRVQYDANTKTVYIYSK